MNHPLLPFITAICLLYNSLLLCAKVKCGLLQRYRTKASQKAVHVSGTRRSRMQRDNKGQIARDVKATARHPSPSLGVLCSTCVMISVSSCVIRDTSMPSKTVVGNYMYSSRLSFAAIEEQQHS